MCPFFESAKTRLFQVAPGGQSTDQQHREQQCEARLGHHEDAKIPPTAKEKRKTR